MSVLQDIKDMMVDNKIYYDDPVFGHIPVEDDLGRIDTIFRYVPEKLLRDIRNTPIDKDCSFNTWFNRAYTHHLHGMKPYITDDLKLVLRYNAIASLEFNRFVLRNSTDNVIAIAPYSINCYKKSKDFSTIVYANLLSVLSILDFFDISDVTVHTACDEYVRVICKNDSSTTYKDIMNSITDSPVIENALEVYNVSSLSSPTQKDVLHLMTCHSGEYITFVYSYRMMPINKMFKFDYGSSVELKQIAIILVLNLLNVKLTKYGIWAGKNYESLYKRDDSKEIKTINDIFNIPRSF